MQIFAYLLYRSPLILGLKSLAMGIAVACLLVACGTEDVSSGAQCPDPESATVRYISQDPSDCEGAPIMCGAGESSFNDDCGCGCLNVEPGGGEGEGVEPVTCAVSLPHPQPPSQIQPPFSPVISQLFFAKISG